VVSQLHINPIVKNRIRLADVKPFHFMIPITKLKDSFGVSLETSHDHRLQILSKEWGVICEKVETPRLIELFDYAHKSPIALALMEELKQLLGAVYAHGVDNGEQEGYTIGHDHGYDKGYEQGQGFYNVD
jgi:flagellar biosynthesis/type III secretory pathway protein FliH